MSHVNAARIFLAYFFFFFSRKYQPDYVFLKYVPIHRVHMFTIMQLFSLIVLWVIKSNPTTSIGFPVRKIPTNYTKKHEP